MKPQLRAPGPRKSSNRGTSQVRHSETFTGGTASAFNKACSRATRSQIGLAGPRVHTPVRVRLPQGRTRRRDGRPRARGLDGAGQKSRHGVTARLSSQLRNMSLYESSTRLIPMAAGADRSAGTG